MNGSWHFDEPATLSQKAGAGERARTGAREAPGQLGLLHAAAETICEIHQMTLIKLPDFFPLYDLRFPYRAYVWM